MGDGGDKGGLLSRLTLDKGKRAEQLAAAGEHVKAAKLYARAGDFRGAAREHARSGDKQAAVEAAFKAVLGKKGSADPGSTPKHAGELLASAGYHPEAVVLFELGGAFHQAAKSALKSGQRGKAGMLFDRAKQWTKAATCYEKVGRDQDALRVLGHEKRRLEQELEARRGGSTASQLQKVERKRAELMAKLGRSADAAAVIREAPERASSAALLEKAGKLREAFDAYVESGEIDEALAVAKRIPGFDQRRIAEVLLAAGRHLGAAKIFAAIGARRDAAEAFAEASSWDQAARQWRAAGQPLQAAECHVKAGEHVEAGRLYQEGGQLEKAADSFLAGGEPEKAAACYGDAGRTIEAATTLLRAGSFRVAADLLLADGKREEGVQALRQIPAEHPDYAAGNLRLAEILFEDGKVEDALHRVRLLPADEEAVGEIGKDRLYWEARALEGLGRLGEAKVCYEKLAAFAPEHRDVEGRLRDLLGRLQGAAQTAASMAGLTTVLSDGASIPGVSVPAASVPGVSLPGMTQPGMTQPGAAHPGATQPVGVSPTPMAPSPDGSLPAGTVLAERYEIVAELGKGGMGRVYRAKDGELGGVVALKTLLHLNADSAEEERLLREVQVCRGITHPNIVRVHDIGRFPGGLFVTMELLEGRSLSQLIEGGKRLQLSKIKAVIGQVAAGLAEAHSSGVIHRDLKPANLFIADRRIKILDFGIARQLTRDTRVTEPGHIVGSPLYMSPEQLQGEELDARSDLYSLGVVAYTLLAGKEPFLGETLATIAIGHLSQTPPDLRERRPDLTPAWHSFIGRILAKAREDRFATAAEVRAAVAALEDEKTPQDPSGDPTVDLRPGGAG